MKLQCAKRGMLGDFTKRSEEVLQRRSLSRSTPRPSRREPFVFPAPPASQSLPLGDTPNPEAPLSQRPETHLTSAQIRMRGQRERESEGERERRREKKGRKDSGPTYLAVLLSKGPSGVRGRQRTEATSPAQHAVPVPPNRNPDTKGGCSCGVSGELYAKITTSRPARPSLASLGKALTST